MKSFEEMFEEKGYFSQYVYTESGKKKAEEYAESCKRQRNMLIGLDMDTGFTVRLPEIEDFIADINYFGLGEDNEYRCKWGITDNCQSDEDIILKLGTDIKLEYFPLSA